jgi:restriction system protein
MVRYYRKKQTTDTSPLLLLVLFIIGLGIAGFKLLPSSNSAPITLSLFGCTVVLLGAMLLWLIIRQEQKRLKALSLSQIDTMTGIEFEHYVGELLKAQGYHIVYTPMSGDYGTDIIAKKEKQTYSIQLKRYAKSVGLEAVQQAVAGKTMYQCTDAMVITNSTFTKAAKTLAASNNCLLIDRRKLADWIVAFQQKK